MDDEEYNGKDLKVNTYTNNNLLIAAKGQSNIKIKNNKMVDTITIYKRFDTVLDSTKVSNVLFNVKIVGQSSGITVTDRNRTYSKTSKEQTFSSLTPKSDGTITISGLTENATIYVTETRTYTGYKLISGAAQINYTYSSRTLTKQSGDANVSVSGKSINVNNTTITPDSVIITKKDKNNNLLGDMEFKLTLYGMKSCKIGSTTYTDEPKDK